MPALRLSETDLALCRQGRSDLQSEKCLRSHQQLPQIKAGWLSGVRQVPSRNFGARPPGCRISLIVVHCISLPPAVFGGPHIDRLFCGRLRAQDHPYFIPLARAELSAHFAVSRNGLVTQYVSCLDRAWHAGVSSYAGRENCNNYSVGIELEGTVYSPYTREQYRALWQLIGALRCAYPAIGSRLAAHSDIAPGRKADPGMHFDRRIFRADYLPPYPESDPDTA